jgi:hypothetical protein
LKHGWVSLPTCRKGRAAPKQGEEPGQFDLAPKLRIALDREERVAGRSGTGNGAKGKAEPPGVDPRGLTNLQGW